MADLVIKPWNDQISRPELIVILEEGDNVSNASFNVAFASDPEEAASFLEEDIDLIAREWNGTEGNLEKIFSFVRRNRK